MRVRVAAVAFLCAEGVLGVVWCVLLFAAPHLGAPLLPAGLDAGLLRTLAGADLVFFAVLPLVAALAIARDHAGGSTLLLLHTGGVLYAALWAWGLVLVTGGGLVGASLMTPSALALPWLAWALHCDVREAFDLRPRIALPAGPLWNSVKTLAQTLGMWLVFLVALPAAVYEFETLVGLDGWRCASPLATYAGAALVVGFAATGLYLGNLLAVRGEGTPLPLDTTRRLVIAGPYRFVRNPMAMVSFGQGFGVAFWLGSPLVTAYVVCGMLIWNYLARPWEEQDLEERFGDAYRRYRDHVDCWRVRLRPYDPALDD